MLTFIKIKFYQTILLDRLIFEIENVLTLQINLQAQLNDQVIKEEV